MRGCQGIPLPKKPAHGLRGSRPAAPVQCCASGLRVGRGGALPVPAPGEQPEAQRAKPLSQAPRLASGVEGTWPRCPRPGCRCSSCIPCPALRATPVAAEGASFCLQRRCGEGPAPLGTSACQALGQLRAFRPLPRTAWGWGGVSWEGRRQAGPSAPMYTGRIPRWKTRVGTRSGGLPRGRKDSPPRGRTSTLCLGMSSGAALSFWILVLKQDLWREPGQVQCPLQG